MLTVAQLRTYRGDTLGNRGDTLGRLPPMNTSSSRDPRVGSASARHHDTRPASALLAYRAPNTARVKPRPMPPASSSLEQAIALLHAVAAQVGPDASARELLCFAARNLPASTAPQMLLVPVEVGDAARHQYAGFVMQRLNETLSSALTSVIGEMSANPTLALGVHLVEGCEERRRQAAATRGGARPAVPTFPSYPWIELLGDTGPMHVRESTNVVIAAESGNVNLVGVMGGLRCGNSTLVNLIADEALASTSPQSASCRASLTPYTRGVHLGARLLPASRFGAAGGPSIGLLDTEGFGERGYKYDAMVATPAMLLGKVVLLQWASPNGPMRLAILETLKLLIDTAVQTANLCTTSGGETLESSFGHLHIVLRECAHPSAECHEFIFESEDVPEGMRLLLTPSIRLSPRLWRLLLPDCLLLSSRASRPGPSAPCVACMAGGDETHASVLARNLVREEVLRSFEDVTTWCLPPTPAESGGQRETEAAWFARAGYATTMSEMRASLGRQLTSPKILNGKMLTGELISTLTKVWIAA